MESDLGQADRPHPMGVGHIDRRALAAFFAFFVLGLPAVPWLSALVLVETLLWRYWSRTFATGSAAIRLSVAVSSLVALITLGILAASFLCINLVSPTWAVRWMIVSGSWCALVVMWGSLCEVGLLRIRCGSEEDAKWRIYAIPILGPGRLFLIKARSLHFFLNLDELCNKLIVCETQGVLLARGSRKEASEVKGENLVCLRLGTDGRTLETSMLSLAVNLQTLSEVARQSPRLAGCFLPFDPSFLNGGVYFQDVHFGKDLADTESAGER